MHGAKHQLAHALISGRGVIIKSGAAQAAPAAPTPTALVHVCLSKLLCMCSWTQYEMIRHQQNNLT